MRTGTYKGNKVKVYDSAGKFILEFENGSSITVSDLSEVELNQQ